MFLPSPLGKLSAETFWCLSYKNWKMFNKVTVRCRFSTITACPKVKLVSQDRHSLYHKEVLKSDWIHMRLKERHVWVALSKCHALKTTSETTGSSGPSFSSSYIIWSYTTAFSHKQLVNWTPEVQAHFRGLQHDLCGRDWISTQGACYGISGTDNGCTSNTGWVKHHWWNWWPSRKGAKLTQKNLIL